jgi:hypothetical protein
MVSAARNICLEACEWGGLEVLAGDYEILNKFDGLYGYMKDTYNP